MAYEARRNDEDGLTKEEQNARSDANNAKLARTALEVADKVPLDPATMAIVKGVKAADDLTGGAVSKTAGKVMTVGTKMMPGGVNAQKGLNKLSESGAVDTASKAVSMYDKLNGGKGDTPDEPKTPSEGGEQKSSLPSSGDGKPKEEKPSDDVDNSAEPENSSDNSSTGGKSNFLVKVLIRNAIIMALPTILVLLIILIPVFTVVSMISDFQDAFGISEAAGMDTGGISGVTSDPDQIAFYNRVVELRNEYQSIGKNFDPLMVISVFHALNFYDANIVYSNISANDIKYIVDCMFQENNIDENNTEENSNNSNNIVYVYDEQLFRQNLNDKIIPMYLPLSDEAARETIINEIFDYIERYHSLIGDNNSSTCSNSGTCNYNINGFYINGANISRNYNVSNLYVRLMQCGDNYGGSWGQPLEGEELVPFEKYILGVAYAEIGPSAPEQAFKAQMIAARSYILGRTSASSSSWRTMKQEGDKWVIQAASCTADQVYCDPDRGCHSSNGQSGQVHSGPGSGGYQRGPIDANSPLRQYASDVQGEVLINSQGNIIYTPYMSTESNQFTSLARNGLDYKQIMIQVYSQKFPTAGVSGIQGFGCGGCSSNGDYASWKQYEGAWVGTPIGTSGRTISQIGCLATAVSIQIARSGVPTNISGDFNPGSFVEYLNTHGGFYGGNLNWSGPTAAAPSFVYQNTISLSGLGRQEKLNRIREIVSQNGVYAVCEVKGNTGQHWVAIDSVNGDSITMMDPGSSATDMWSEYNWANTSQIVYYRVS